MINDKSQTNYRDFFISYCSKDEDWARWLVRRLEEADYTCWVSFRDFHGDFKQHMQEGLLHCRFTLALLSKAYLKSKQCTQEWCVSLDTDKLIVVRIEPVEPQGLLRTQIYVDLYRPDEEKALAEFLTHIKKRLTANPIEARPKMLNPYEAPFPGFTADTYQCSDSEVAKQAKSWRRKGRYSISRRQFLLGLGAMVTASSAGFAWWWWRPPTFEVVKQWKAYENSVRELAFSPDGKSLITGSSDGNLDLWRLTTAEHIRQFVGHEHSVTSVAFSPSGREIASASIVGSARLWRTLSGAMIRQFDGKWHLVRALAYAPDGRTIFIASGDYNRGTNSVRLMDCESGEELQRYKGHEDEVTALAVSPGGKHLLTGSRDRTARLWEVSNGETIKVLKGHRGGISTVALSPNGSLAVTGSSNVIPRDHGLRLWNLNTETQVSILDGHEGSVNSVLFTRNGRQIISASGDMTVRLWDVAKGVEINSVKTLSSRPSSLALSPVVSSNGWDLVVGDSEGIITHVRLI